MRWTASTSMPSKRWAESFIIICRVIEHRSNYLTRGRATVWFPAALLRAMPAGPDLGFASQERHQAAAVALEAAGELELKEHRSHDGRRSAREPDKIVDGHRRWSEEIHDSRALAAARLAARRAERLRLLGRQLDRMAEDGAQHRDHVVGLGNQGRTLLEQLVAALRARIERRAGHREDFAALLERKPRGDERARPLRRLH